MHFKVCGKSFHLNCLSLELQFLLARAKGAKRGGDHRVGRL
jgi:hypothetical protein